MDAGDTTLMTGDDFATWARVEHSSALADLIVRSATDLAIVTSTTDGVITSWSPGAEKTMGWSAADAVGQRIDLFFTPEDIAAGWPRTEMDCARDHGFASDERWHMKADGSRFWANGEMQPLREGGEIVGYLKILRDRTERHEMEQKLRSAEAEAAAASERLMAEVRRLREMFEQAPGFIAVLRGPELRYELVNASYLKLIGHRDVAGKTIREALPEVEGQGYFEKLDRVFASGEALAEHNMSVMLQQAPGAEPELRYVDYVFQPMHDADGAVTGLFLEGFDVTDAVFTRLAAEKLAVEQAAILGQLAEGVIATDADGRISFVNAAAERLHGVARLDIAPDACSDTYQLLTEDGAPYPSAELPLARAVTRGETVTEARWRIRRPDGTEVLAIGNAQPVIADGRQVGAVLTVRDDTARREAESKLAASEARVRSVLEGMNEGMVLLDAEYRVTEINAEGLRLDGHPREYYVGRHLLDIWPESEHMPIWPMFQRAMTDREPGSVEYRHLNEALDVWIESRVYPIGEGIAIFYRDVTDRRRATDAISEREARFRELADNIPTLCWTAHADGEIFWYNKRWYEYSGTTPETQLGWGWEAIHDPERLPEVTARWSQAVATGTPFDMTFPLKGVDGTFRRFLTRIVPIRDEQGRVVRWFGTNIDVEEQSAAEERMRASEERYRTLFEAIDAGFCVIEVVFDDDGQAIDYRFLEINRAFGKQTGLSNAIGKTMRELAPDTDQRWIDLYAEIVRSRTPVRIEDFFPGLERWYDVYAYPIDAPEAMRVAVLFNDVSERKRAEVALTELNRTLETRVAATVAERDMIWRISQDLFVVVGMDGIYRSVNPAWTEILGYEPGELIGAYLDRYVHPDDSVEGSEELARLMAGHVINGLDLRMLHKDGGTRWVSWTCVPQGDVFYASGRDVTARKELEEHLRQSQKMEAVGQLTGGIAHDFNNLLTIVSGNIDMARRSLGEGGDTRALRSLGNAAKGADRAAALTQRLLAFSRRQPLQPRATDVNKLITGMTELLDRALGETVDLQVVAGAGLWRVEVDPNQLENAILNLAVNARDAMPAGGKLTVETGNAHIDDAYAAAQREVSPGQYVLISVTDTGEGMPADIVAKAFDPFFSTKEVGKGTGLGLSQVYGYIKQSGGHVKIYSEAGEGTTVKLYLPRLIADMNAAEEEEPEAEPAAQGQESILVVEDDDDVRIYTVDSLRELGYRVLEAHDGASALRLLERQDEPPRLLLTDVVMPGMSGRELAEEVRTAYPDLQVLYTTGYARNAIVHGGRLDPGVELLPKPFTFEALAAKVREVIEKAVGERALVIDPTDAARTGAVELLGSLGFIAEPCATVREALGKLRAVGGSFDIVILSDALPVGNFDAVVAELRVVREDLPILIVSDANALALQERHRDARCVDVLARPFAASALREALGTLRVKCGSD